MGANRRSADNYYQNAKAEYDQIAAKYSGEAGWNLANEQAKEQANQQSKQAAANAGAEANIAARTAGVSKARAANTAAGTSATTAGQAYTTAFNNSQQAALANNQAMMQQAGQELATEQTEARNRFDRKNSNLPFASLWR